MIQRYRVLLVDDENTNNIIVKKVLDNEGYEVDTCNNGLEAIAALEKRPYDVVITDWMMPKMDGIELIRKIRESIPSPPYIIMVTALVSEAAKEHALDSGADYYIGKPIDTTEICDVVHQGVLRLEDEDRPNKPTQEKILNETKQVSLAPFVAVGIAASTGGPPTLTNILKELSPDTGAAFFVVQHGPEWMLETFVRRLEGELELDVSLAKHGQSIKPNTVYVPPGDYNLSISHDFKIILEQSPKENFVRPAADPTFRSMAHRFGAYTVGVVLTGLGKDGGLGLVNITDAGGKAIIQEPQEAIASSMPNHAVNMRIRGARIENSEDIAKAIEESIFPLASKLKQLYKAEEEA